MPPDSMQASAVQLHSNWLSWAVQRFQTVFEPVLCFRARKKRCPGLAAPNPHGFFRAGLAAGQQVGNGAIALCVPDLGIALVLAFDKGRVVGLIELPFHI